MTSPRWRARGPTRSSASASTRVVQLLLSTVSTTCVIAQCWLQPGGTCLVGVDGLVNDVWLGDRGGGGGCAPPCMWHQSLGDRLADNCVGIVVEKRRVRGAAREIRGCMPCRVHVRGARPAAWSTHHVCNEHHRVDK